MLVFLFWLALALGVISLTGAIAEKSTGLVCAALGFTVISYAAAVGAQWL